MKLWLIEQNENTNWDTFDSAVVTAKTAEDARNTYPEYEAMVSSNTKWVDGQGWRYFHENGIISNPGYSSWVLPENVRATYIGETELKEGLVVISSFNAG